MASRATAARAAVEQRPVLSAFVAAVAVRLGVALVVNIFLGFESFPDVSGYDDLASDRASGAWHGWGASDEFFYDRYAGYVLPVSILYRIFGAHLFAAQALSLVLGAAAAAAVARLTLEFGTRLQALIAGAIVAFLPLQFVFSSVPYKDSSVWAAVSAMALLSALASRATGWRLASYGAGLAALAFWLSHLRVPTFIIACWMLLPAALLSVRRAWFVRVAGAVLIALFLPWYVGAGPAGYDLVRDRSLGAIRAGNAEGAESGFIEETDEESIGADLKHLPDGLRILILEPTPWTSFTGTSVRLAQLEIPLWYLLLGVAAFGLPDVLPNRRPLAFLVLTSGSMLFVFALLEGNFGTAYRHRGELVPCLAVLGALGSTRIWRWWSDRRRAPVSVGATTG